MSVDGWIDDGKKVFSFYTGFVGIGNAGGIEAVWGLRQLYGYAVSNHSLYVLTVLSSIRGLIPAIWP